MGFLPWEAIKDSLLEDIITKMREYPALYNKEMPEYKHGKWKEGKLAQIANELESEYYNRVLIFDCAVLLVDISRQTSKYFDTAST